MAYTNSVAGTWQVQSCSRQLQWKGTTTRITGGFPNRKVMIQSLRMVSNLADLHRTKSFARGAIFVCFAYLSYHSHVSTLTVPEQQ
jgi:hypothetical protein